MKGMQMDDTRVYTHVSGKALKGMQQLFKDREIYISANVTAQGYTVMTAPKKGGHSPFRKTKKAAA